MVTINGLLNLWIITAKQQPLETAMKLFDQQLEIYEDYIIALHPFDLRTSNAASLRCILSTENQQCYIIVLHPFDWESAMLHHCAAFFLLGISNAALLRCILSTENQQCNSSCDEPNWSTIRWIDTNSPGKGQPPTTTDYRLRTTDYGLRTTDYGLRTTDIALDPLRPTIGNLQWLLQRLQLRATYNELYSNDDATDLIPAPLVRVSLQDLLRTLLHRTFSIDNWEFTMICKCYIIALHPFDMRTSNATSLRCILSLRINNVTNYSDHCIVLFSTDEREFAILDYGYYNGLRFTATTIRTVYLLLLRAMLQRS